VSVKVGGWARLPPRTARGYVNVVVETPRGSQNKYKYDEKFGLFRLNRILFAGASFPFDFGFIAGTRGGDGDPLDAILLVDAPTFPGCIVRARPIGVLLAHKDGKPNHRVVLVPIVAKTMAGYRDIGDIPLGKLGEIEQFFRAVLNVDGLEHSLDGFGAREEAERIIVRSVTKAHKKTVSAPVSKRGTPKPVRKSKPASRA